MASTTLGRVNCPIGCGHTAAQVKLKTDKGEDKTAYPYIHCAGCGIQMHTRNGAQARHLAAITRPEKVAEVLPPPAIEAPSVERATGEVNPQPTAKKPPSGFLTGFLMGAQ
jgi:hypothetical protein